MRSGQILNRQKHVLELPDNEATPQRMDKLLVEAALEIAYQLAVFNEHAEILGAGAFLARAGAVEEANPKPQERTWPRETLITPKGKDNK